MSRAFLLPDVLRVSSLEHGNTHVTKTPGVFLYERMRARRGAYMDIGDKVGHRETVTD